MQHYDDTAKNRFTAQTQEWPRRDTRRTVMAFTTSDIEATLCYYCFFHDSRRWTSPGNSWLKSVIGRLYARAGEYVDLAFAAASAPASLRISRGTLCVSSAPRSHNNTHDRPAGSNRSDSSCNRCPPAPHSVTCSRNPFVGQSTSSHSSTLHTRCSYPLGPQHQNCADSPSLGPTRGPEQRIPAATQRESAPSRLGADDGRGVLRWLDVDDPLDRPCDRDRPCREPHRVRYQGRVNLLQLRGGGIQVTPAETEASSSTDWLCGKCRKLMTQEVGWSECQCGRRNCHNCEAQECPCRPARAAAPSQKEVGTSSIGPPLPSGITRGHVRHIVNNWEAEHAAWLGRHLGQGARSSGGVLIAPWARIEGTDGSRQVRICPMCHLNRPADGPHWRPCRDGTVVCDSCRAGLADGQARRTTIAEDGAYLAQWNMCDATAMAAAASPERSPLDQGLDLARPALRNCAVCNFDLDAWGCEWRLCSCHAIMCTHCWTIRGECTRCRGDAWTHDFDGDGQHVPGDADSTDDGRSSAVSDDPQAAAGAVNAQEGAAAFRLRLITPSEADVLRESNRMQHEKWLRERRTKSKAVERRQVRDGTRPPRPPNLRTVSLLTMNTNCAKSAAGGGGTECLFPLHRPRSIPRAP